MDDTLFYLPASGKTYGASELYANTGFSPTTDPGVLAANGIYTVIRATPPADIQLYTSVPTYTVVGNYAEQSWVPTARPLPVAIENGSTELKQSANGELDTILCDCGINNDVVTAVASQDLVDRPARFQDVLDVMTAVTDSLDSNLTAVESATTVDEINDIVNPPTGLLFTGRGAGLGPEDLNVSYYTAWNSVSMLESDTELYVPSTSTVIAYGSGGPTGFDSAGDCFNVGGPYVIQIRQASTSRVIAEFEVPLNPAGEDVAF